MNEHTLCCGTVADKAKLCAEIEKRDSVIRAQQRRISELLQECDEALAYTERLRSDLTLTVDDIDLWMLSYGHDRKSAEIIDNAKSALSETPSAALAAMKAKWQAEAIAHIIKNMENISVEAESDNDIQHIFLSKYVAAVLNKYLDSITNNTQEPK